MTRLNLKMSEFHGEDLEQDWKCLWLNDETPSRLWPGDNDICAMKRYGSSDNCQISWPGFLEAKASHGPGLSVTRLVSHLAGRSHFSRSLFYIAHIVPYDPLWSSMVPYGTLWSSFAPYGPLCSSMVSFVPLWSRNVLYGPIWSPLVL